jgi:subtilisin-like proprotein convertase family protein
MYSRRRPLLLLLFLAASSSLSACHAPGSSTVVARGVHTYAEGSGDIPDNDPRGFAATLTLSDPAAGTPFPVRAVAVSMAIEHPRKPDLEVVLIHPDGTPVRLHRYDPVKNLAPDAAYSSATPPGQDLAVLNGKPLVGTWRLLIKDRRAGEVGRLQRWTLAVTYAR